jgi:uncharacterized RDD family membrane protein YckC
VPTGFERIGSDTHLQNHWIKRLVAFIIDAIIVAIGTLIITVIIAVPFIIVTSVAGLPWFMFNPFIAPFFMGMLSVLYFALLESYYGWTFGKRIMKLNTVELGGQKPFLIAAIIRNISKIYWILILVDVLIGLATLGDPHQKASDRIAGTTVVSKEISQHPPPSPP